jgi:hypothetical protein
MIALHKFARGFLIIALGPCLSSTAFADDLEIPPTYEKCIGSINSLPIEELETACGAALTLAFNNGQPLAIKIEKAKKDGETIAWYKQNELDHWMLYAASAAYHQVKWNNVRLGIKTDKACSVATSAMALFQSVSKEIEPSNPFFTIREQTTQFYTQCQKSPINGKEDGLSGLSISSMKQLVAVYSQNPKKRDSIVEFVAIKFQPSWENSKISNAYKPLREEFSARYAMAKKGLSEAEFTTLKRIYFEGLKALDKHNHDQVPDFIYNWLEE